LAQPAFKHMVHMSQSQKFLEQESPAIAD